MLLSINTDEPREIRSGESYNVAAERINQLIKVVREMDKKLAAQGTAIADLRRRLDQRGGGGTTTGDARWQ